MLACACAERVFNGGDEAAAALEIERSTGIGSVQCIQVVDIEPQVFSFRHSVLGQREVVPQRFGASGMDVSVYPVELDSVLAGLPLAVGDVQSEGQVLVTAYAYIEQRVACSVYGGTAQGLHVLSAGGNRACDVAHLVPHRTYPTDFCRSSQCVGGGQVLDGERTIALGVGAQVLHVHHVPSRVAGVEGIVGVGRYGVCVQASLYRRSKWRERGNRGVQTNPIFSIHLQIEVASVQSFEYIAGELFGDALIPPQGNGTLYQGCRVARGVESNIDATSYTIHVPNTEGDHFIYLAHRVNVQLVPSRFVRT